MVKGAMLKGKYLREYMFPNVNLDVKAQNLHQIAYFGS